MAIQLFQVDAFADKPFSGNPAAVCLMTEDKPDQWLQNVAAEMNLSETAFVWRLADAEGFRLRWFTPTMEVDLCGHATLATAHSLWQSGWLAEDDQAVFESRSGKLTATKKDDHIYLNFPATPAVDSPLPDDLKAAIDVQPIHTGKSREDFLIVVATADEVRNVNVDFQQMAKAESRGVILTAKSDDAQFDFISRFFGPAVGIDEDPVTGSAHCCLAPFWSKRLGKDELVAFQASQRGGTLKLKVEGERIHIGGTAQTVSKGELLV